MKSYLLALVLISATLLFFSGADTYAQQQEPVDLNKLAEEEADRLFKILDLEDWQVFYVDSTLKANFVSLQVELEKLHASKVSNTDFYQAAKDKCWDEIDANFKKWFTEKQWKAYLKSGAEKLQKQRAKRKEKAGN